jgi:hypothetical protein
MGFPTRGTGSGSSGVNSRSSIPREKEVPLVIVATTTTTIDGRPVPEYIGVVSGEEVPGASVFRDLFAGLRDIVSGRSAGYER